MVQTFAEASSGDALGIIVDAAARMSERRHGFCEDRWAVAFLLNRVFQGSCAMASPTREPRLACPFISGLKTKRLFLFVHLDAAGDEVELRKASLDEAPDEALAALDAYEPPSWGFLVSDVSEEEAAAPRSPAPRSPVHVDPEPREPREPVDVAPSLAAAPSGLKARLRELKECLEEGLLTLKEFEEEKAILLQAMRPVPVAPSPSAPSAPPMAPPSAPSVPTPVPSPVETVNLGPVPGFGAFDPPESRNFAALLDHCAEAFQQSEKIALRQAFRHSPQLKGGHVGLYLPSLRTDKAPALQGPPP